MKLQIITRELRCPKCNRCGSITREEVGSTGRHDKVLGTTGCISADDHGKPICACGNKALRAAKS